MDDDRVQNFVTKFGSDLCTSFSELTDGVEFYLFVRNAVKKRPWLVGTEDYEWNGYCGEKADPGWMKCFLEKLNAEYLPTEELVIAKLDGMAGQDHLVYFLYEGDKRDSGIENNVFARKKDLIWLVRGSGRKTDIYFLIENVIEKTREQLSDLIYLSYLEQIEEYLFQAVRDKNRIREKYIEKICNEAGVRNRELISLISARKYEKREIHSRIYFGEVQEDKMKILFDEKNIAMWEFSGKKLRFIRKMLEMTREGNVLVVGMSHKGYVMKGIAELTTKEGNQIIFGGYLKWKLMSAGKELLSYEDGKYHLPCTNETEEWKELVDLHLDNVEKIKRIIINLCMQAHGTSAIFLEDSILENELKRLGEHNRICRIRPVSILHTNDEKNWQELIIGISAIDGALIMDYQGNVHAIGAILDGESVIEADLSRGARYNSLTNYINWLMKNGKYERRQAFAVIISEDGDVNIKTAKA